MLGIASAPLFKLGRGVEQRATSWPKIITIKFPCATEPGVDGGTKWIERWFRLGVYCKNS